MFYKCLNFVPIEMGCGISLRTGITLYARGYRRVFVVFDKGVWDFGIAPPIVQNMKDVGLEVLCYDKVLPDPPDTVVEEAAEQCREFKADAIVGIGGGSSMDTAKAVNVLINNPPPLEQYIGVQSTIKPGLPLFFIPTTAGTGSEATSMCVISFTKKGVKDSVLAPQCCNATLAIVDPELTLGLPPKATAVTGVDAFSHALEAITSNDSNPVSDALARETIRMIYKWLPVAVKDGSNIEARSNMLYAALLGGICFTNSITYIGHSISHVLGANFHIPHGIGCGVCLPQVIEWSATTESEKVRMICESMGVHVAENADAEEVGAAARKAIRAFTKEIGIPNFKELEIPLEDLIKVAPLVPADPGAVLNPFTITAKRVEQIFTDAWEQ